MFSGKAAQLSAEIGATFSTLPRTILRIFLILGIISTEKNAPAGRHSNNADTNKL